MEEYQEFFSKLENLDKMTYLVTGLSLLYSISLAIFRHSTFEDHGIWDSISDVLKYCLLITVVYRYGNDLNGKEKETLYAIVVAFTFLLSIKSYYKYVAGVKNPVVDLKKKVYIVTGSNAGIGFETALQLASMNATVILACRNKSKAEAAKQEILSEVISCSSSNIIVLQLDLCSFDSVVKFVKSFLALKLPLHGLINNAGVMTDKRQASSQDNGDMEVVFQSNHLSHFLLTNLLLKELKQTGGRVVNLSSSVHNSCPESGIQFHDLFFSGLTENTKYSMFPAYGQSKLANILFTQELQKRLMVEWRSTLRNSKLVDGDEVPLPPLVVAVHPGCVRGTDFTKNMVWWMQLGNMVVAPILSLLMKTREQGAYSTLHCLLGEREKVRKGGSDKQEETTDMVHLLRGGHMYYHGREYLHLSRHARNNMNRGDLDTLLISEDDSEDGVSLSANNDEGGLDMKGRLWEVSEKLTNLDRRMREVDEYRKTLGQRDEDSEEKTLNENTDAGADIDSGKKKIAIRKRK